MAFEKRIPRVWALVISILVSGPVFHLLLFDESFVSKYGSVTIKSSSGLQGIKNGNSGLPTEGQQVQLDAGSVDGEKGRLPTPNYKTIENRWTNDKGNHHLDFVEEEEDLQERFNTWEEEQRRRRSLVDKACAASSNVGIGKKSGKNVAQVHQTN